MASPQVKINFSSTSINIIFSSNISLKLWRPAEKKLSCQSKSIFHQHQSNINLSSTLNLRSWKWAEHKLCYQSLINIYSMLRLYKQNIDYLMIRNINASSIMTLYWWMSDIFFNSCFSDWWNSDILLFFIDILLIFWWCSIMLTNGWYSDDKRLIKDWFFFDIWKKCWFFINDPSEGRAPT